MAVVPVVNCPECEKKFKPKGDVQGKKIKCPFCAHAFVVPAAKQEKDGKNSKAIKEVKNSKEIKDGKNAMAAKDAKEGKNVKDAKKTSLAAAEAKANPDDAQLKPETETPAEAKKPEENFDADPDPYGVKNQDLAIRCPHCAKEMPSANAIICLHCGYNTLTRAAGKTAKTLGITTGQHLKYLGPALGAATFTFFSIIFLLYYTLVSPYHVDNTMFSFTDHESLRMWTTMIFLGWIFGAGSFCYKKFIEKPKPDEIRTDI